VKNKHLKAYFKCAEAFAECSDSKRLKVGSVIVKNNRIISCGYNALPEHMKGSLEDEDGNTKPHVRHSEKNALLGLIKSNESAVGATLICTHACCEICAVDIVDAGITEFYYKYDYRCDKGVKYLKDNNVIVYRFEED
jgi:dCMP deaminase